MNRGLAVVWLLPSRATAKPRVVLTAVPELALVKRLKSSDAPGTLVVIAIACQAMIDDCTDRLSA